MLGGGLEETVAIERRYIEVTAASEMSDAPQLSSTNREEGVSRRSGFDLGGTEPETGLREAQRHDERLV